MQSDHTPEDRPSEIDEWRTRRAAGSDSLRKFLLRSWGGALVPAGAVLFLTRNDERLPPAIKLPIVLLVVVILGGAFGLFRWMLNERRFKRAERLGRLPTQADDFGKAGEISIPNHYVFIGFGVVILVCIAIVVAASLANR